MRLRIGIDLQSPLDIVPLVEASDQSNENLFRYIVYTKETGSSKKSYELEPLDEQFYKKMDLFYCKFHAVYGDSDTNIGVYMKKIKVNDFVHNSRVVKRRTQNTWVNVGLSKQDWNDKKVRWSGGLNSAGWVVRGVTPQRN